MSQKKNKKKASKKKISKDLFGKLNCYVVVWRQNMDDVPLWAGKSLKAAKAIAEALTESPERRQTIASAVGLPTSEHITVEIYRFENGILSGRMHINGQPEKTRKRKIADASRN
jgi:hypothetical protein